MRTSPAFELAIQLAVQETSTGGFLEIEPEHIVMGLLKLAELPPSASGPDDVAATPEFREEVAALATRISDLTIDSTAARRQLRARLGRGPATVIHDQFRRSQASKMICEKADIRARRAGADAVRPLDLFDAILESPTPLIAECLARGSSRPHAVVAGPSLLDEHGTDLVRRAAAGELPPASGSRAAWRAMYLVLSALKPRNVFALSPSIEVGRRVVEAMAHAIQTGEAVGLARTRLIDLTEFLAEPTPSSQKFDLLTRLLDEAAESPDAILVVFWQDPVPGEQATLAAMLESACESSGLRLIVVTTEEHAVVPGLGRKLWLGRMQAMTIPGAADARVPEYM